MPAQETIGAALAPVRLLGLPSATTPAGNLKLSGEDKVHCHRKLASARYGYADDPCACISNGDASIWTERAK
jgi:hypothetical protein